MTRVICGVFLLVTILSCANKVSNRSQADDKTSGYSEDLSIIRPEMNLETPIDLSEKPAEQVIKNSFKPMELKNENTRIEMALNQISSYNAEIKETRGFRIQVFSGNNRGEYESAKAYILQNFPELEIYESYSQPTYRIKVGDFLKRMDAERYYSNLVNEFSSSKIITDRIDIQKGFKID